LFAQPKVAHIAPTSVHTEEPPPQSFLHSIRTFFNLIAQFDMATNVQQVAEETVKRDEKLRKRFKCFRILILGRANAGKTTILQKVCNTNEQPVIFDGEAREASNLFFKDIAF
jgi:cytidylate kinase